MNAGSPISSNPSISKNATHLTLMWSPPFLWPGYRIQHYNISMTNKSDSSIAHHVVDSSVTNPIVTSSLHLNTLNMLSCIAIIYSISPVDGPVLEPIQNYSISYCAWTFPSGGSCRV